MNNFKTWQIKDMYPDTPLLEINPISSRAYSLLSRNIESIKDKQGAVSIIGFLETLEGLDYHHNNFSELSGSINLKHEITAYLNRIGQLHYFVVSEFTKKHILYPETLLPKIDNLIEFRHKNSAHRSLDKPSKGKYRETDEYRNRQAIALLGFTDLIAQGKKQFIIPIQDEKTSETVWHYFTPETDHIEIMNQSYNLLEKLLESIKVSQ
jgi:hypothetical protein